MQIAERILLGVGLICVVALSLNWAPSARATVRTSTTIASFGSFGAGVCRGAAVGIGGYEAGQVVAAHPVGAIASVWSTKLQVTPVPGPAPDQVGYKVCNISTSTVSAPEPQAILLGAISSDSGQATAVVERNFGSIAAHACLSSAESVSGAQPNDAVTAQPNGGIATAYGASGGLQLSAYSGANAGQVTLKVCNLTGEAINPPTQSFLLAAFPATMPGVATNTSTLTYGQLGSGTCYGQTFGVPGAAPGDVVIANPIAPVGAGYADKLVVTGLSALSENPNEASYKLCNIGATALTPPSQNFRVMALHPPAPPCDPVLEVTCMPSSCDPVLDALCNADPCLVDPSARGCAMPSCGGHVATILGTARSDSLRGGRKRDVIVGLGGNDVLVGGGGNDLICGGRGKDRLSGGGGTDSLFGGAGDDQLLGGPGNDRCQGSAGKDRAKGCKQVLKVP